MKAASARSSSGDTSSSSSHRSASSSYGSSSPSSSSLSLSRSSSAPAGPASWRTGGRKFMCASVTSLPYEPEPRPTTGGQASAHPDVERAAGLRLKHLAAAPGLRAICMVMTRGVAANDILQRDATRPPLGTPANLLALLWVAVPCTTRDSIAKPSGSIPHHLPPRSLS